MNSDWRSEALLPQAPPKFCSYFQCALQPAVILYVLSGDDIRMRNSISSVCEKHYLQVIDGLAHEMVNGGPCRALTVVLP